MATIRREAVVGVAYKHRNDIVLSGHDHLYERFQPMDGAGRIEPSTRDAEFIVGTGGKNLYPFGTRKAGSVYRQSQPLRRARRSTCRHGWYSLGLPAPSTAGSSIGDRARCRRERQVRGPIGGVRARGHQDPGRVVDSHSDVSHGGTG